MSQVGFVDQRTGFRPGGSLQGGVEETETDGVSSVQHAKLGKEHFLMPDGFEKITLVKRTESITEVT